MSNIIEDPDNDDGPYDPYAQANITQDIPQSRKGPRRSSSDASFASEAESVQTNNLSQKEHRRSTNKAKKQKNAINRRDNEA